VGLPRQICGKQTSARAQYAQRIAPYLLLANGVDSENHRGHDPAGYGFA